MALENKEEQSGSGAFLKDVLICSLGAYGGPEAHFGVFTDQLVTKKKYLNEEELIELIALCSILPGPTSTQTIVAIGHKRGGPWLGFLTMLVWALPILLLMTMLSFVYFFLETLNLSGDGLRYIGPMAVGFIVVAAWKIGTKVATDRLTITLLLFGALVTYAIRAPWIFPLVLVIGGAVSIFFSGQTNLWNTTKVNPPWKYLAAFGLLALSGIAGAILSDNRLIQLFESFYRYGYLVFGGGQVVVPVMYGELVILREYLTSQQFLTGFGLVQGLPGPMFSFAAFAGGLAVSDHGILLQIAGAMLSGISIFLPGLLLIFFIYPVWEDIKKIKAIKISLRGINAIAGGMITAAAVLLMQNSGMQIDNIIVMLLTTVILFSKKVPAPLIVVIVLIAGFLF